MKVVYIVKTVYLVVQAAVLAVSTLGPKRIGLGTCMLNSVLVGFLGRPFEVVSEVMPIHRSLIVRGRASKYPRSKSS